MAGLRRLKLDVPHVPIDPAIMLSAAAQGALSIQTRTGGAVRDDAVIAACAALNCQQAAAEVSAERALLAFLDGSCHTPISASAELGADGSDARCDGSARMVLPRIAAGCPCGGGCGTDWPRTWRAAPERGRRP